MELRKNCKTALLAATSMGVRITPYNRQSVETSNWFYMQATSAESNVLSVSAALGLPTKVLTAFVQGSPISQFIKNSLGQRHIAYEAMEVAQGGPWGYRHQFNIADSGYGMRAPRVHNDRAGEVGRLLDASEFDLARIFEEEGVAILHLSGLIAALSPETGGFCVELARAAKQNGTRVSFDLNHRASFWKGREDELRAVFAEIAGLADILVGNEEDFQLCLGIRGPEAGGENLGSKLGSFKAMILRVKERFPNVSLYCTTLRQVISANEHLWGALILDGDAWHYAEPREIPVLDRIGGGDGFVGGLLYGLLKGFGPEKAMRFGWAAGALATAVLEDYVSPADEEQVWGVWEGNARVRR